MTTDDLLLALPPAEDNRWECKSAVYLDERNKLNSELGKQVSAFANSGGGYVVFGIADKDRAIEPCSQLVGRQSMKDWLSTMVESSVEYPIRHYRIHRIPLTTDHNKSIFVIAVEDSPAAPHQSKFDRNYFYRIDGHSKPAPHFHVELLRNRITKAVLEIERIEYFINKCEQRNDELFLVFGLSITVKNCSMQSTTTWGIHFKTPSDDSRWRSWSTGGFLKDGVCHHDIDNSVLLPGESKTIPITLKGLVDRSRSGAFDLLWKELAVVLTPVTQNSLGKEVVYGNWSSDEWESIRLRFVDDFLTKNPM